MGNETSSNVHPQQNKKRPLDETVTITSPKSNSDMDELKSIEIDSNISNHQSTNTTIQLSPMSITSPTKSAEIRSFSSLSSVKTSQHRRRRSSLITVDNGITGKLISSRICKIAATFWSHNVEQLSVMEQLEIGMSIYFGMLSASGEMKNIMKSNFNQSKQIERTSLRYLDMMGWLIRHLITDNIDLHSQLSQLGVLHDKMGICIEHYTPMLHSLHETFAYYFGCKYNVEVKYALDEIFSFAANVMTGKSLKCNAHLNDIHKQFARTNVPFLKNLDACLASSIGKEYLYTYLSQTFCDEIIIFLKSLSRFKHLMTDKERFFVARDITQRCIDQQAIFCLNLSYETRNNAMYNMVEKERLFVKKEPLYISTEFFSEVEHEVYKLIMHNHWSKFSEQIKMLQSKSYNVDYD